MSEWRLKKVENDEYEVYAPHPDYEGEELLIAEVYWPEYAGTIAAAPELLEACKHSLPIVQDELECECDPYYGVTCGLHKWQRMLEEAIAKAEEETKNE